MSRRTRQRAEHRVPSVIGQSVSQPEYFDRGNS
jgi:hypothetical protein